MLTLGQLAVRELSKSQDMILDDFCSYVELNWQRCGISAVLTLGPASEAIVQLGDLGQ